MPKLLDTLIKLKLIPWDDSKLKKSVPEFGINLSEMNLPKLDEFIFEKTIENFLK